jgi:fatty-acyl-CoA synthase
MTGAWYRTGDLVISDHDGDFQLAGPGRRHDHLRGLHIHPEEVKAILGRYPGVADVAVVDVPDDR